VKSNCEGNDRHVEENSDPGPYAPDLPAMKTMGTMSHCVPGAPPATGGSGSGSGSGSSGGSSSLLTSSSAGGADSSADAGASGESSALTEKTGAAAVLSASELPLPIPPVAGGIDRFATLLIGAGAYLVFRKPVRRLLRRPAT
jgi:hypothetical protein